MYTSKDIEIFVLTYNREKLLKKSVESLLFQTIREVKITVVDNNSSDGTESMVKQMQQSYPQLHYCKQMEHGKNPMLAREMASAEYVMIFHDDDVLHPQYIEIALKLLNKYKNVDLICSRNHPFCDEKDIITTHLEKVNYLAFPNREEFMMYAYADFNMLSYPNVIYRTKNINSHDVQPELYGKCYDKPAILCTLKEGWCLHVLHPEMLNYRIHSGQDSMSSRMDPNKDQVLNHQRFMQKKLRSSLIARLCYHIYALIWIDTVYMFGHNKIEDQKDFYRECYREGLINLVNFRARVGRGRWIFKAIINLMQKIMHKWLKGRDKSGILMLEKD